jgi:hypothetical protein
VCRRAAGGPGVAGGAFPPPLLDDERLRSVGAAGGDESGSGRAGPRPDDAWREVGRDGRSASVEGPGPDEREES